MFHVREGYCFERIKEGPNYGGVRVAKINSGKEGIDDASGETLIVMTASEWSSVAASMTCLGESGATHGMFFALQKG